MWPTPQDSDALDYRTMPTLPNQDTYSSLHVRLGPQKLMNLERRSHAHYQQPARYNLNRQLATTIAHRRVNLNQVSLRGNYKVSL